MKSLYHRKRLCCLCLAGVLNLTGLTVCGKSAPSESYPDNSISYEEGSALTSEPTISTDESSAGTASPGQPTTRKPTTNRDTGANTITKPVSDAATSAIDRSAQNARPCHRKGRPVQQSVCADGEQKADRRLHRRLCDRRHRRHL